ncbi:MAG: Sua5/YciO/YrdC/YwlC family protein, partial [Pseudomonadota bacterium]
MSATILPGGPDAYARAAALLRDGQLVALPTETVYGLAGDARSDAAVGGGGRGGRAAGGEEGGQTYVWGAAPAA